METRMFFCFRLCEVVFCLSEQVRLSNKICMNMELNVNSIKTINFFIYMYGSQIWSQSDLKCL